MCIIEIYNSPDLEKDIKKGIIKGIPNGEYSLTEKEDD